MERVLFLGALEREFDAVDLFPGPFLFFVSFPRSLACESDSSWSEAASAVLSVPISDDALEGGVTAGPGA